MRHVLHSTLLALALSGCALVPMDAAAPVTGASDAEPATEMVSALSAPALGARAVSAESLDTTTDAQKAVALAAPAAAAERQLGRVIVALGPPAEQGIWLKTALVGAVVQGRVETAAGKSLAVELRPGTGGALLSLAAFQALGLRLTELPELTVFAP